MDQTYMKEKPVVPLLLSMGIPVIISMIAGALYNIVDSIFVAMISEDAMTAVSLVYPIQNLAHAAGVGFGVGINAMVARRLGEGKTRMANQTASQGVFLSALHGMILTILGMAVIPYFLRMFTSDEVTISYGLTYFYNVFLFSTIDTMGMAYEKVYQSVGKMKISMAAVLIGCGVNIVLDPIFIFGLHMDVRGAALATIIFCERGLPFLYQGQEIGMSNRRWKYNEFNDLETINQYQIALKAGISKEQALEIARHHSRDNARTPMQWTSGENAGFTKGTAWLKINPDYKEINVEDQENNPDSVLNYYRKLVALRKSDEFQNVFTYGEFIPEYEEMDDILAFYRTDAATSILVVANFGTDAASIELKGNVKRVLMSNQKEETVDYTKNRLNLKSCEVVVLEMKME
mgnify:CR=1 FL=1